MLRALEVWNHPSNDFLADRNGKESVLHWRCFSHCPELLLHAPQDAQEPRAKCCDPNRSKATNPFQHLPTRTDRFLRRPLLTFHQDLATGLAPVDNGGIGDAPNMVNSWRLKGLRLLYFFWSRRVRRILHPGFQSCFDEEQKFQQSVPLLFLVTLQHFTTYCGFKKSCTNLILVYPTTIPNIFAVFHSCP